MNDQFRRPHEAIHFNDGDGGDSQTIFEFVEDSDSVENKYKTAQNTYPNESQDELSFQYQSRLSNQLNFQQLLAMPSEGSNK